MWEINTVHGDDFESTSRIDSLLPNFFDNHDYGWSEQVNICFGYTHWNLIQSAKWTKAFYKLLEFCGLYKFLCQLSLISSGVLNTFPLRSPIPESENPISRGHFTLPQKQEYTFLSLVCLCLASTNRNLRKVDWEKMSTEQNYSVTETMFQMTCCKGWSWVNDGRDSLPF